MHPSAIFPLFVSIMFAIWAAYQLYSYAMKGTRKRVLFVSYMGFLVSFTCVVLIPFDIDSTLANRYRGFLYYAWRVMYWSLQLLSWVIYPFNMEKERTGSWRKSLHRNAIWWGIYALVALVALAYFFVVTNLGFKGLLAFAYAASNTFGLLLIILLAGYGLVACPRWMYLKSNPKDYLESLYVRAVIADDARMGSKLDLIDIYNMVKKSVSLTDPNMIASKTFLIETYGYTVATSEGEIQENEEDSAKLKEALQTAKRSNCSFQLTIKDCVKYERIVSEHNGISTRFDRISVMGMRGVSISFALLSILILVGEATIFTEVYWLSVLAIFFRKGVWESPVTSSFGSFFVQLLLSVPLLWIYYCCYWSLTRLKLAKFYGLYPMHNTDTISLMWCGGMLIRIAFPLVYNYLFVLHVPDHPSTVFEEMQGWMDVVPILGDSAIEFFPLLILVVALLTLTNMYSRMMKVFGLDSLQFESDQGSADEGRKLVIKYNK